MFDMFYGVGATMAIALVMLFVVLAIWAVIEWPKRLRLEAEREAGESAVRASRAQLNGWRYVATPQDDIKFRLTGTTAKGVAWQIWFDLDAGSSSSSPKLIFLADALRDEHPRFHIGDAENFAALKAGAGRKLLGAAKMMLDSLSNGKLAGLVEFYDHADSWQIGSWIVAGTVPAWLQSPRIRSAIDLLERWPRGSQGRAPDSKCVEVWQGREGLKIEVKGHFSAMPDCEQLQRIGAEICAALLPG